MFPWPLLLYTSHLWEDKNFGHKSNLTLTLNNSRTHKKVGLFFIKLILKSKLITIYFLKSTKQGKMAEE